MSWQVGPHPEDEPGTFEPPPVRPMQFRSVASQIVIRPRADTREVVVLELLPLAAPALAYGATQVLVPWGIPLVIASILVTGLASMVVASRDRGTLRSRGFVGTAPAVLALFGPVVYLVVRGRACRGHDRDAYAPVPWAIGITVVAVLVFLAVAWFQGSLAQAMDDVGGVPDLGGLSGLTGG